MIVKKRKPMSEETKRKIGLSNSVSQKVKGWTQEDLDKLK